MYKYTNVYIYTYHTWIHIKRYLYIHCGRIFFLHDPTIDFSIAQFITVMYMSLYEYKRINICIYFINVYRYAFLYV